MFASRRPTPEAGLAGTGIVYTGALASTDRVTRPAGEAGVAHALVVGCGCAILTPVFTLVAHVARVARTHRYGAGDVTVALGGAIWCARTIRNIAERAVDGPTLKQDRMCVMCYTMTNRVQC